MTREETERVIAERLYQVWIKAPTGEYYESMLAVAREAMRMMEWVGEKARRAGIAGVTLEDKRALLDPIDLSPALEDEP